MDSKISNLWFGWWRMVVGCWQLGFGPDSYQDGFCEVKWYFLYFGLHLRPFEN